jgi:pilus assembly protein CpaE
MVEMRNNGVPLIELAPKASITQAIVGLADALSGGKPEGEDEVAKPSKSRLLGFLSKGSKAGK